MKTLSIFSIATLALAGSNADAQRDATTKTRSNPMMSLVQLDCTAENGVRIKTTGTRRDELTVLAAMNGGTSRFAVPRQVHVASRGASTTMHLVFNGLRAYTITMPLDSTKQAQASSGKLHGNLPRMRFIGDITCAVKFSSR